ncbi:MULTISPECIES: rod shape-determining protein RodA [Flavobacterium]|uniref:rod shape-determining protein RodA n=1 Tax=Flavobacterium TaxID=237 RepID=UPI000869BE54|nr:MULTISPECIES: rod shape-determining protein RodA [Flavobacterium]MBN9283952.1 rod shape-determining protein RodA [Flavobacterium sp.]ODS82404.1 MAG: rod shape-determining protein RodA [Chryseobacterium sp. SCN 40-13]OJV73390.1 MAG: rod shape-determining protein RodA [Flavobacterium sp. 40-81]
MKNQSVASNIDWITILIYIVLVAMGWMNIYSASLPLEQTSIFDLSQIYGKQMLFILLAIPLIFTILSVDAKIFEKYAVVFYALGIVLLLGLFAFGKTIKGQTNWYQFGGFGFQPSEFVKTAAALLLAKLLSDTQINIKQFSHQVLALAVFGFPVILIMLQPDAGSAMIFISLVFVLYREGLPSWYLWTGFIAIILFVLALIIKPVFIVILALMIMIIHYIFNRRINRNPLVYGIIFVLITGFVFSVDYVYENVLESHQKDRINVLLGKDVNMQKEGYNLNQSMIAIGSGSWIGKGYLEGTQTKGGFVPEQHTDYIFTTVGEEWGFAGAAVVIALFVTLFLRIIYLAEHQKTKFSRVYGYCVATFLFTHFFVNISMLIKMFPTIGVPLPFFSYGGSSLWAFTILLFIFLKMDANKVNEW